jgi:exodeoxyribonuclease-3
MRIITLNCNGLRSAASKGMFDWLAASAPDVVCLQETRAHADQRGKHGGFGMVGMDAYFEDSHRPGYSGVALYCRRRPDRLLRGIGVPAFDQEGRWLEARWDDLSVVSLYLPSGSSSDLRQAFKYESLDWLGEHLARLAADGRRYIICGDINIAHRQIDLKNWRSNQKNSGFLPDERAWMDRLLADSWRDSFRLLRPETAEYTWWSNRGRAWDNNVGWRIDYQLVSRNLADQLREVSIYRDQRFSDHAPYTVDYQLPRMRRREAGVPGERG